LLCGADYLVIICLFLSFWSFGLGTENKPSWQLPNPDLPEKWPLKWFVCFVYSEFTAL